MGVAVSSFLAFLFRVSSMLVWLAISVLTARTLSVEDKGVYGSAIILSSAIGGVSSLSAATGYFVSHKKQIPAEVAANSLLLAVPIAAAIVVVGCLIGLFASGADRAIIILASLSIGPGLARSTMLGVLLGRNQAVAYNIASHLPVIGGLVFLVSWLGILHHRTAEDALGAWCLAQWVSLLPFAFWGQGWWTWFARHKPSRELIVAMLRFSVVTAAGGVVGVISYRVDQLLVIWLDGKKSAGIFSSAAAGAEVLWLFSSAIAVGSFARIGHTSRDEAGHVTATGVRHTILVVVLGGIAAAMIGPFLIELLFGRPYRGATEPLRILCVGTALFAPQALMNNYFVNQLGKPWLPMMLSSINLSLTVMFGLLLIPNYGTSGAAWATTLSYTCSMCVCVTVFLRTSTVSFNELWRIRWDDIMAYLHLARDVLNGRSRPRAVTIAEEVVP